MTDVSAVDVPTLEVSAAGATLEAHGVRVHVGPPGPRGPRGESGGAEEVELVAATALSGHCVVLMTDTDEAGYASASNPAHVGRVIGITTGAAAEGAAVTVRTRGPMTEGSWTWTPGAPVYCGVDGVLTHTSPSGGQWAQIVGVAASATQLWVAISLPIQTA